MNFFFIVDTSFSMMQVCNHYSLLDLAKVIIERFVDVRVKSQESKFDRYFVSTTCPAEYDIIPYTLPLDSYIFNVNLKTILVSHQTNAVKSIIKAYTILNEFRLLYEHDGFMGGRDPFKTDSSIIIFITDGSNASYVDTINEALRSDFQFSRWDQQFFTFLLNPLDARNRHLKNRPAPRNYSKILDLCQTLNGNCLLLDSPDTIPNFIETFLTRLRHKISLSFKRIKLENFKYDVSLQPMLGKMQPSTIPKLDQDAVAEPELKGRLVIRPSTGHLSTKFSASHAHMIAARYPFPEDPYSITPGKFVQKLNIDMQYESEISYPNAPLYYIDFTKFFLGKLAFDFPLDRFEIDSGSELYNFVCEYVKGFPTLNKIVFPVLFNNLYGNKQSAKMEIFALLRYVRSELDNSIGMELLVYPLNFPAFNDIWEEASKFGSGQSKMKAEFSPDLTQKLEIYFEKTPFYYSNYLFALFSHKKMGDYINRKWRFFTNFCSLNNKNTDLTNLQTHIKKYIPEKTKKKQENDLKIGVLKAKRNTNPEEIIAENRRAVQKAKEERQQAPGVAEHNKNSLISRVLAMKDELFAPQVHEAGVKGENLCSKPMSKMSNYHEYMAKFAPLKNPHEEDTERKFYKEPIPFGNPFKYVVRSKQSSITDNYEDQAFLTSFNQLPLVDRNKNDRGVSPRGPQKPVHDPAKEKHRLSTQSFNLKSLQTALEVSSGRSTPVIPSSPVSGSTVESAKSDYNFSFDEVKEKEVVIKPKEKEKERVKSLDNIPQKKKMEEEKKVEKIEKVEKQRKEKETEKVKERAKVAAIEPVKPPKKKVNPHYFMICNATVFKDFAMFLKDPPKPTLTESIEEHVRREGVRIVESLDIKNTPDILKMVLWKLDDMLKVYNYRNVKLENGFKQFIVGV